MASALAPGGERRRGAARSRRSKAREFSWAVGSGEFGELTRPDGRRTLIETVRMTETEAVAIDLTDGSYTVFDYQSHRYFFTPLRLEEAAQHAGMPTPVTRSVGDMLRRVDPFHSPRHLNASFRALVALIVERNLPSSYGLLLAAAGRWDGLDDSAHGDDAEQTAADVSETLARNPGWTHTQALRDQLTRDAAVPDDASLSELLGRAGWMQVLADLPAALAEHANANPYPHRRRPPGTSGPPIAASTAGPSGERPLQLSLLSPDGTARW